MAHQESVRAKPEDFTESGSSPPSGAVLSSPRTQPPRQPSRRRRTPRRGRPSGRRRTETPLDPFALARSDIANQARDNKTRRLLRHWWRDRDGHYQTVDEVSVRIRLTHWATRYIDRHGIADANGNLRQVTGSFVSNVLNALRAVLDVPEERSQPAWLGADQRGNLLAVSNGLRDVARLIQGDGRLSGSSLAWRMVAGVPIPAERAAVYDEARVVA